MSKRFDHNTTQVVVFLDHAKSHIRDRRREMNPTVFWINLRFILLSCFWSRVFLRAPGVRRSPDWMICSTGVRFQSCALALFLDARMHAHARTPRVHELFLFLSWFDPDSMSSVALFDFSFSTLSGFQPNSSFCWTFHSIHFI